MQKKKRSHYKKRTPALVIRGLSQFGIETVRAHDPSLWIRSTQLAEASSAALMLCTACILAAGAGVAVLPNRGGDDAPKRIHPPSAAPRAHGSGDGQADEQAGRAAAAREGAGADVAGGSRDHGAEPGEEDVCLTGAEARGVLHDGFSCEKVRQIL
jgi:hypothetical protein